MVNIEQGFTGWLSPAIRLLWRLVMVAAKILHPDPTDLIKASLRLNKPLVVVHFSHRLNVLGYGVYEGKTNFGFHDQKRAIEWVEKHISSFGGDPANITLAGESAGGIAVHGHLHGPNPSRGIRRAVLQSGSLYLTPATPVRVGMAVMEKLHTICGQADLRTMPAQELLAGINKLGFKNWWINEEAGFFTHGPEGRVWPIADLPELESILIGDCQWESRGFEPGIAALGLERLQEIFAQHPPQGAEVAKLYDIDFSSLNTTKTKIGAFINDLKFAFASDEIARLESHVDKRKCYRYVVDQTNPWKAAAGAHHAIDLLFLFGGYDYSKEKGAVDVSEDMRAKWIAFCYGDEPWPQCSVYSFGPDGLTGTITREELAQRRRINAIEGLRKIGWIKCQPLATRLMSARGVVEEAY